MNHSNGKRNIGYYSTVLGFILAVAAVIALASDVCGKYVREQIERNVGYELTEIRFMLMEHLSPEEYDRAVKRAAQFRRKDGPQNGNGRSN